MNCSGKWYSLLLIVFLIIGCSSFNSEDVALTPGMLFPDARLVLIRAGWQPNDVHINDGYEFVGVEKKLRDSKIPEIESCAVDKAICIFNYKSGSKCIRLITQGEEISEMRVKGSLTNCLERR